MAEQGARAMRIGKNIKMFRDQANMTQEELATRVNLAGGAQIAQFEAGTKTPSLEKAMDIAIQCGVSLSQLVGEHPPPGTPVGHVTNHIHGDNQTVYQHVERACLLSEDLEEILTAIVVKVLEEQRTALVAAVVEGLRAVLLPAEDGTVPAPGVRPIRPPGTEEGRG